MSDGISDYWKAKRLDNMVRDAANAAARVIQRPDLDKTPTVMFSGKSYKLKIDKVELVYHNGEPTMGGPIEITEIPVLGKFEVKE